MGSPPQQRRGMLAEGPAGVVADLACFGNSTGFRTTPAAAAGCCLPLVVQGGGAAPFSPLRVPPQGMRGSPEITAQRCDESQVRFGFAQYDSQSGSRRKSQEFLPRPLSPLPYPTPECVRRSQRRYSPARIALHRTSKLPNESATWKSLPFLRLRHSDRPEDGRQE